MTYKKQQIDPKKVLKIAGIPVSVAVYALWQAFKAAFIGILITGFVVAGMLFGAVFAYINTTEPLEASDFIFNNQTSFVFDKDGNIVQELKGMQNRIVVEYEDVPKYLVEAFVAIEDSRFWTHNGIDIKRTAAAVLNYAIHFGRSSFGGSTITQQLVKNVSDNWTNSIQRKIQEQYMAIEIEKKLTKEQIITSYMNIIYMGSNIYGVESAAQAYFGKSVSELSLAECAAIAGITNQPGKYAPVGPITRGYNESRQRIVLAEMLRQGKIKKSEYDIAINEKLAYIEYEKVNSDDEDTQSYFVDAAISQAINDLMAAKDWSYSRAAIAIYNEGTLLYTTLDPYIQEGMDKTFTDTSVFFMNEGVDDPDLQGQAAMIILDPYNGYVRAVRGGYGEKTGILTYNFATQMQRQPGSTFKPIAIYGPLIDTGVITAGTVIDDVPVYMDSSRPNSIYPTNYESTTYQGLTTIHDAVMKSLNVVAAKAYLMDSRCMYSYLDKMDLNRDNERYVSLALGGLNEGTNPLRMAAAYSTFVNGGIYTSPTFYTRVTNTRGEVLIDKAPQTKTIVFSEETAAIMTDIMSDVTSSHGTAGSRGLVQNGAMPTAGKTGTSGEWKDKWFVSYTPYYVGAVWYGYTNPTKIPSDEYNVHLKVWQNVMEYAHANLEPKPFTNNAVNLVSCEICKCSGKRPSELCYKDPRGADHVITTEYYISGTEPAVDDVCDVHVEINICKHSTPDSLKRYCQATDCCPEEDIVSVVMLKRTTAYVAKKVTDPLPEDWYLEVREAFCDYCETVYTPRPTPEPIPTLTPDITPETTPEVTPEPSPEPTQPAESIP